MAKKAKDDAVGREWIHSLAKADILRLYVFYGEEKFRRDAALDIIKKRIVPETLEEFNFIKFEGKGLSVSELDEAIQSVPVMSERKMVVVKNFDIFKESSDELIALMSDIPDEVCLVFLYDDTAFKPDRRTKMYQLISKIGAVANFVSAEASELRDWIRRRFADLRKNIENSDIDYLIFYCGTDMYTLQNEISKVANYAPYAVIRREDIEAVATRSVESRVFDLCEYVASGKASQAMGELENMIKLREAAVLICAMLGRQMRRLYITKCALDAGNGTDYITKLFSLGYSFQGEKLVSSARRISLSALRKCTLLCADADKALKSSRQEDYDVIKNLLLSLVGTVGQV